LAFEGIVKDLHQRWLLFSNEYRLLVISHVTVPRPIDIETVFPLILARGYPFISFVFVGDLKRDRRAMTFSWGIEIWSIARSKMEPSQYIFWDGSQLDLRSSPPEWHWLNPA